MTANPSASSGISAALRVLLPSDAQGCGKAAWARLTDGIEGLSGADIQQRFATEGIEITLDAAVELKVDAVIERPSAELPVVAPDDKHAAPPVDCNDGPKRHGDSLNTKGVILTQGGAA